MHVSLFVINDNLSSASLTNGKRLRQSSGASLHDVNSIG